MTAYSDKTQTFHLWAAKLNFKALGLKFERRFGHLKNNLLRIDERGWWFEKMFESLKINFVKYFEDVEV